MGVDPRYRPPRLGLRKRKGFSAPVWEVTGPEQTAISAGVRPDHMKSSVSSSATVAWNLCLTWEQFEFAVDVSDACDIKMSAIRVYESVFSSWKITASGFGEIRGQTPNFPAKLRTSASARTGFAARWWLC